jgi:CRP-like cAMP-binding protein
MQTLTGRNRLLSALPSDLQASIAEEGEIVDLHPGEVLQWHGECIKHVYFPTGASLSSVLELPTGHAIEVTLTGTDGFAPLLVFLEGSTARWTLTAQIPGRAFRIAADVFRERAQEEPFRRQLTHYAARSIAVMATSTACVAFHVVEQRLARWLLLVRDAVEAREFPLTHEFMGTMLGVYRPTVTVAVRTLTQAGMIDHRRGVVRIVDDKALEDAACECYRMGA